MHPVAKLSGILLVLSGLVTVVHGAEPKYMDQPFAVIAFSGFDQTEAKLDQFGKLTGNRQLLDQFLAIQNNLGKISGLDRNRTVGGVLILERAKLTLPAAVFLVPVTNGAKMVADLRKKYPVFQTISKGKWRVNIPGLVLYVSLQKDYLAITQSRPALAVATKELLDDLSTNTADCDLFTTLHFDGMSEPLRERILNGFDIDFNRAIQPRPEETEESLQRRTKVFELIRATARQLVSDTQTLTTTLKYDSDVQLSIEFQARAESEFEKVATHLLLDEHQISITPPDESALHIDFGLNLPEPAQRVANELFNSTTELLLQELKSKLSPSELKSVTAAMETFRQGVLQEQADGFVSVFEHANGHMSLLAGKAITDEGKIATSIETTLPHLTKSESITNVELNFKVAQPLQLHRFQSKQQVNQFYGPDVALYVGTGPKAIWGGIGNSEVPQRLMQAQQELAPGSPTIFSVNFSADQWLRISENNEVDSEKIQRYRTAIPNAKNDHLQFNLKPTTNGLKATLRADQNYLKLLGAGSGISPTR